MHQTRLENGLAVIVAENHTVPLATVLLAVRNGAFTQDSSQDGLTHLYEHMLFRAYPGGQEGFQGDVAAVNGRFNGGTNYEVVYYFVGVQSRDVDAAIKIIARLVESPDFSRSDLKEERAVVLDELQRYASDPERQAQRQVDRLLWGSSWSRKDLGGDSSSLAAVTLDHLKRIYTRYYIPNNAALIVTGDVPHEHVFLQAGQRFGDWRRGPDPFATQPVPPIAPRTSSTAVMVANDAVSDVSIRIALHGPSVTSDTTAACAADVLFDVLNDPASMFQQRLLGSGLFQYVFAYYLPLTHTGPIEFVAKDTVEHAQEGLLALHDELDGLTLLEGVSDEDLATAVKRRRVEWVLSLEDAALLAPSIAAAWASPGMEHYLHYDDCRARQTLNDLQRFVRTYIASQPRVIGVLAPPAAAAQLSAWLRQGVRRSHP